jgi:hypothetical protein
MLGVCLIGASLAGTVRAQDPTKPGLRQVISVQMPAASEAVAMPAADEEEAIVVTVTAEGKLFVGMHVAEVNTLTSLKAPIVYVKADSRYLSSSVGRQRLGLTSCRVPNAKGPASPARPLPAPEILRLGLAPSLRMSARGSNAADCSLSTFRPCRRRREASPALSCPPESRKPGLRWSASGTRSSLRSAGPCESPWLGRLRPP